MGAYFGGLIIALALYWGCERIGAALNRLAREIRETRGSGKR